MTAERFHIMAQRGDLKALAAGDGRHGAMLETGGHGFDPGGLEQFDHAFGGQGGGDIDVPDRTPKKSVAHAATDKAHRTVAGCQGRRHLGGFGRLHPGLRVELPGGLHGGLPSIYSASLRPGR